MWTSKSNRADPEGFDAIWRKELEGQRIDPDRENRAAMLLGSLIGSAEGLSVLDLGGGATLSGRLPGVKRYVVVDCSLAACTVAVNQCPTCEAVCADACEYLRTNTERFDMTLCFGTLTYLPSHALDLLMDRCPSPILCVAEAKGEGYLQYPGRLTGFCDEDFKRAARKFGWKVTKALPNTDHIYMRMER